MLIGLPDTSGSPRTACALDADRLSFLLFPVDRPELFDAVATDAAGVREIWVKSPRAGSAWVWAMRMPGAVLHDLDCLACARAARRVPGHAGERLAGGGGVASGIRAGTAYVDVGTLNGYRAATELLQAHADGGPAPDRDGLGPGRAMTDEAPTTEQELIRRRVHELGPWFHNMNLGGVWTAPEHFLGDYPNVKWQRFAHAIPADLRGRSVLDVGCNAGFYALEMRRRGADRVVAVDADLGYLAQARFAAEVEGAEIEFRQLSVYEVGELGERFDLVLFLGCSTTCATRSWRST